MANLLNPSTPPPSTINTPNTPQFGFYDNYQPYSPRRSSRLAQRHQRFQRASVSSHLLSDNFQSNCNLSSLAKAVPSNSVPNFSCSQTVSKLHGSVDFCSEKSRKGTFTQPSDSATGKAVLHQEISSRANDSDTDQRSKSSNRKFVMLPTPSKTPKKKSEKASKSYTSIARNLFPVQSEAAFESNLLSNKKANKKDSSSIPDKTSTVEKLNTIKIFIDSHDRIPEIDSCPNNPFYTEFKPVKHDATRRKCKRRKIMVPGEGLKSVEDIQGRKDGLLYVFRGKKVWKKFSENIEAEMDAQEESLDNSLFINDSHKPSLNQPLTRSPMKPRLLFPQTRKRRFQELEPHSIEDEEADTDIEENVVLASKTPVEKLITTPKFSITTPVSPPSTLRVTRSKKANINEVPSTPTATKNSGERSSKFRKIQEPKGGSPSDFFRNSILRSGKTLGKTLG